MPSKKWARVAATDPDAAPDETGEDTQAIGTCVNTDDAAGKRILGERLQPVEDSTMARRRGGKAIVTDAPFAESREWIVGSGILDCSDVDEVLEIAAQHPTAARGRLELRPFWSPADEAAVSERLSGAEHYGADSRNRVDRALTEALAAEWLRIVATLIRTTGDWDLAEDAVADAVERALRRWPRDGVPENPAAWLTTTARRRAIDLIRRADAERCRLAERCALAERSASEELWSPNQPSDIPSVDDDRLRLVFTCCHPALTMETRVALTLKAVYGLSTAAIARAFLTSEAAMRQRLLRAKRKICNDGISFRVPSAPRLAERLEAVLGVVYLVFTSGHAGLARALAEEAIRLGRPLVKLMPDSDEARGLLALMLLHHARREARTVGDKVITLEHQDRSLWDTEAIAEALTLAQLPGTQRGGYRIQADLAAVHATANDATDTDWPTIVGLYDELLRLMPSPIVELNRAIAVGMSDGPLAGIAALDDLTDEPKLAGYYLLPAARADLLARAGLLPEAVQALGEAMALAPTDQEARQLARRRSELTADIERSDQLPEATGRGPCCSRRDC